MGLPLPATGEKDASNNSSIDVIVSTKWRNLASKMFNECSSTSLIFASPFAISVHCSSIALRTVGNTSSSSIL
jgi:hypothetical protein